MLERRCQNKRAMLSQPRTPATASAHELWAEVVKGLIAATGLRPALGQPAAHARPVDVIACCDVRRSATARDGGTPPWQRSTRPARYAPSLHGSRLARPPCPRPPRQHRACSPCSRRPFVAAGVGGSPRAATQVITCKAAVAWEPKKPLGMSVGTLATLPRTNVRPLLMSVLHSCLGWLCARPVIEEIQVDPPKVGVSQGAPGKVAATSHANYGFL